MYDGNNQNQMDIKYSKILITLNCVINFFTYFNKKLYAAIGISQFSNKFSLYYQILNKVIEKYSFLIKN